MVCSPFTWLVLGEQYHAFFFWVIFSSTLRCNTSPGDFYTPLTTPQTYKTKREANLEKRAATKLQNQTQQVQEKIQSKNVKVDTFGRTVLGRYAKKLRREAEYINSLLDLAITPSEQVSSLKLAVTAANRTLENIVTDKNFHKAIKQLSKAQRKHRRDFKKILNNPNDFLKKERKLLIETGVTEDWIDEIMTLCEELGEIEAIRFQNLTTAITDIYSVVNELSINLTKNDEAIEAKRWYKIWAIIKSASIAIGGTTLIILNTNALITQRISPAESAVSGAFGGGLISTAVQNLADEISLKKRRWGRLSILTNLYSKYPSVYFLVYVILGYLIEVMKYYWDNVERKLSGRLALFN